MRVAGLVLAGGLARRMGGGQKALVVLAGRPLVAHVLDRMAAQADPIALNVNDTLDSFRPFGRPLVPDTVKGFPGPLAGVLAGLRWAETLDPKPEWLLTVPTDAPFLPSDLTAQLLAAAADASTEVAVAESAGRTHPVVALWRVDLADALEDALLMRDIRKIDRFTGERRTVHVTWDTTDGDPFFNVNRPEDVDDAAARM